MMSSQYLFKSKYYSCHFATPTPTPDSSLYRQFPSINSIWLTPPKRLLNDDILPCLLIPNPPVVKRSTYWSAPCWKFCDPSSPPIIISMTLKWPSAYFSTYLQVAQMERQTSGRRARGSSLLMQSHVTAVLIKPSGIGVSQLHFTPNVSQPEISLWRILLAAVDMDYVGSVLQAKTRATTLV